MSLRPTVVVLLASAGLALGACSSDSDAGSAVHTVEGATCDHVITATTAQDTVERVGGLVADDFTVRFAKSTRLGVVALVDGDSEAAFDELSTTYGVALVAEVEQVDDPGKVVSFAQVRTLVEDACS